MIAPALCRHRRREAGVDDDLAPAAAYQPHEVVERHRPVVRIAADEVLARAARVVRVLYRVDLVLRGHLMVTRAIFLFPTWITTVCPRFNCRFLSPILSPSIRTPPCSIMRAASLVLGTRPASLSSLRIWVSFASFSGRFSGISP